jgi:F-type H+-transporting ATPase subunit a
MTPVANGSEGGFHAPDLSLFDFGPVFSIGGFDVTKPMLLAIIGAAIVIAFFYFSTVNARLVPTRWQSVAEVGYLFVRDEVARSIIGKRGDKWVPLLVSIFFFVWMLNLFSVIPLAQVPVTSKIAYPAVLAIGVWLLFVILGMVKQGPIGYFKNMMFPPGIPKPVYVILAPLEFISTILVRPFTHAVRLFANMFAGHMLLVVFAVGATYLFSLGGIWYVAGVASALMQIVMTFFELLVIILQAYIFTILMGTYLNGSIEAEH